MLQLTPQLLSDTKRREGFSLSVYPDSKGLPTQGFGQHTGVSFGDPDISEATAEKWLAASLQNAYEDALELFPGLDAMDDVRRGACLDLSYNMGQGTLSQFTPFIVAVNVGDWPTAALHLLVNTKGHVNPYTLQVGARAVDNAVRIASGIVPQEFKA